MKSVTRSALLRSSILLSSLSAISAQDVCPGLIAYEVPYLAVYPVSISTYIAANTVFNINGNGYITINNAPTNLQTVITATSTVTSTVTSTATTTTTAAANTAVPSGVVTTIAQPILLDGVPGTTSRIMRRQQSGTYLGSSGNAVQGSCTQGAAFFLTNGQLTLNGLVFSANTATANYALFEASSTVGNVASGFYSNNGVLGWNDTNFDNGIARFCSTGTSFYAVYKGSYPSGCTPFIFEIELETACSGYGSTTISGSTTASGSTSGSATVSGSVTGSVTSPTTTASISISGSSGSSSGTDSTGSTASASSNSVSASTTLTGSLSITSGLSASTTLTGSLSITSASSVSNSSAAASSTTTNTANPTIPTDLPAGATPVVVSFSVPGLSKRQSGGTRYLKSDGTFTADKTQAAVLGLLNGALYGGDTPYSTNPGTDSEVFAVYDDIGTITTLFSLTNGLTWANGNFSINTANTVEFAVVSSTIYAAFNSLPAGATVVTASASTFSTVIGQSTSSSSAGVSTVSASITSGSVSASTGSGSGSTTPASTTSGSGATSSSASTTGSTSKSSTITSSSSSTTLTSSSAPYGNSTSSIITSTTSSNSTTMKKLR